MNIKFYVTICYTDDSDSSYESYYDSDGNKHYKKKPKKVKYGKAGGKKGKLGKSRKDFTGGFRYSNSSCSLGIDYTGNIHTGNPLK